MTGRWSVSRVEAAAPDQQVRTAAQKLARPQPWSDVGVSGDLLWGACQGSGKNPYQVSIDLSGPRYRCSCPSRKFPCKHAVALLFLWSAGHVSQAGIADFAADWVGKPMQVKPRPEAELTDEERAQRVEDAAARLAARESRVSDGFEDLDRFLTDQVSRGLATVGADRYERFSAMASRMVDQQAPGVAGWLRDLATVVEADPQWPERMTDDLGLLRLLICGWQRRDELSDGLAETVRSRIGFSWRSEAVLALPGVADDWAVIGMSDSESDQVSTRRVWLWGRTTGRPALVLFFAAGGAALTSTLYPGTSVEATLHFHPGARPLRAVVGERGPDRPLGDWAPAAPATLAQARAAWHDALVDDPWLDRWPQIVTGRLARTPDHGLALVGEGVALPAVGDRATLMALLHASAGRTAVFAGELSERGFLPTMLLGPSPSDGSASSVDPAGTVGDIVSSGGDRDVPGVASGGGQ